MHPFQTHRDYLNQRVLNRPGLRVAPLSGTNKDNDGILRRWLAAAALTWRRQRMSRALSQLDDRMLHDIGLARADISDLVKRLHPAELRMTPIAAPRPAVLTEPEPVPLAA